MINSRQVINYIKKKCPNFSTDFVHVQVAYKQIVVTVISQGKLKTIKIYNDKRYLDLIIPNIDDVCQGLPWSDFVYIQPYTSTDRNGNEYKEGDNCMLFNVTKNIGPVIRTTKDGMMSQIEKIRENCKHGQNLGFRDVPRVSSAVSSDEWLDIINKE